MKKKFVSNIVNVCAANPNKESNNAIRNTKYTRYNFLIFVIMQQFKSFSSIYFFIVMLLQFNKKFAISSPLSSLVPWFFVFFISCLNEGTDDLKRHKRDKESNSALYKVWKDGAFEDTESANIKTGNIVLLKKGDRVPADAVVLKVDDNSSEVFIRTDQLDGETDWKRRTVHPETQHCSAEALASIKIIAEPPHRGIYSFIGTMNVLDSKTESNAFVFNKEDKKGGDDTLYKMQNQNSKVSEKVSEKEPECATTEHNAVKDCNELKSAFVTDKIDLNIGKSAILCGDSPGLEKDFNHKGDFICKKEHSLSLDLDNTVWANTVIATSSALVIVVYTGHHTRSMMNTYKPRIKMGKIDHEVDFLVSVLGILSGIAALLFSFLSTGRISIRMGVYFIRYMILFSYVIPISLKVTMNMARLVYLWLIQNSKHVHGVLVRSNSTQEELGRISYLLTDKTGTLTKNEMIMKKIHLGPVCFTSENIDEMQRAIVKYINSKSKTSIFHRKAKGLTTSIYEIVEAMSICNSVTPVYCNGELLFQASSPDEIAIVEFVKSLGIVLVKRDRHYIYIKGPDGIHIYRILHTFPFNSDTKRMGIVVERGPTIPLSEIKNTDIFGNNSADNLDKINTDDNQVIEKYLNFENGEIVFLMKGADTVMQPILKDNDWVEEETDNMARDGLRTLLFGKRTMSKKEFDAFDKEYHQARISLVERQEKMMRAQVSIEKELKVIGLTGVEDRLQDRVKQTLENLRNAEIKVWMLTGDKIETAISIAKSSKLLDKNDRYMLMSNCLSHEAIKASIEKLNAGIFNALVIDGTTLGVVIDHFLDDFMAAAKKLDCLVGCRYSPTQKAIMAASIRNSGDDTVCCIGDGGNDVSMITEADVGIGIEGKEGNQASLAADFSIRNFADIADLIFSHGRRCYKNSSMIASILIHRGTIISVIQGIFCAMINYNAISIFSGMMLPLFIALTFIPILAIILHEDIPRNIALKFPELYKEMRNANLTSLKMFMISNLNSVFQSTTIMIGAFFRTPEYHTLSAVVFTCVVINEQCMAILLTDSLDLKVCAMSLLSLVLYSIVIVIFKGFNSAESLMSKIPYMLLITATAILFKCFTKIYRTCYNPPAFNKLRMASV
ncbi:phospholipid-translocating ATPase [Enteropsectra breve]|nr:phospholipid-translocating ATPase [Enteropsectra breve]